MSYARYLLVIGILVLGLAGSCSRDNTATPIDTVPPLPPVGLQVVSEGADLVRLSWTNNAENDLAGYRVYRADGNGVFGPVVAANLLCPWHYDRVAAMEVVTYKVTAMDESGNESAYSEAAGVYINPGWRNRYTNPIDKR